ncbi:MAG TPA: hypothetical protein VHB30_12840 [Solirubrobacteraceae bacterium]|nr:hypothetical protein [Solirubrobacteraceae bacterium]
MTISPISSTWPTTATLSPSAVPGTRATEEPITSVSTVANASAWRRQAAAGAVS